VAEIAAALDDGSHKDLSGDNELPVRLHERRALKEQISTAERRVKEIELDIKDRIGPASTAWLPGWSLSFKAQRRKETVIPASEFRVLRVKEIAEEVE
jgi:predicted phage-related endonuclease